MSNHILAVVGLPGAGKTEATNYIIEKTGWPKVYFGQPTFDVLAERGIQISESAERAVREELRAKHGMGAMAVLSIPKVRELFQNSSVIIESLYSWEEYLAVKQEFGDAFKVLAIFASPQIRTERMGKRSVRPLTPQQLISRDYSQIENLHQAGPIARADWTVINEGTVEEMKGKVDEILTKLV